VRALVFGGAGFIGSHLTRTLVERGEEVTVADLVSPKRPVRDARYLTCDVRQEIALPAVGAVDAVYNLAAVHRTPGHADHEYYETNVAGAQNVTDWCSAHDVPYVCFTSSISVYGPTETRLDEAAPTSARSAYGWSKLLAEHTHRTWLSEDENRRLTILRPAVIFGAGENGNFTRLAAALASRHFAIPGRSDTVKACGYVGDLVAAMQLCRERSESELTANFCYPDAYTIRDICRDFHEVGGYPMPRRVPVPAVSAAKRLLATGAEGGRRNMLGQRVAKLLASTNIEPAELVRLGFEWDTDLHGGLKRWLEDEPLGSFV
jgi:nucleoside-diphosphate-sugar epimerase